MATGPITWEDLTKLDFVFKRDIADRVKTDGVPIDEAGKIIFPNEEIPTYPTLSSENVWTQSALLAVGKTSTVVSQRTVKLYSLSPNYNALLAGITWGVEGFIQYSYQEETLSNGPSGPYLPLSTATNFVSDRYSPDFLPRVLITPSFKDNGTIISAAEVRSKLNAPSSYNVPGVTNQSKFYRLEYTDINFPFTIDYGRGIISFLKAVPRITRTSGLVIDLKDTSAWNVWMDGYVYTGKTLQTVLQEGAGNTGPSGAQGASGPQGIAGRNADRDGNTGASGSAGPASNVPGVTGPTGPQAATGPSGAQGTQGVSGMTGATGPPAATGPSGAQGIQGNAGNPGVTGATGPSGAHGHSGAQGPSGTSATMKGDTGASGPQGIAGTPSTTLGPTGATGPSGPQGLPGTFAAMGNTGPTGASGAQGRQGVSGVTGATGPSGAQGTAGQSGVTGATGPSGVQGNTGNPGMTGPTGPSGVQGNTGNPGVTGATGPSGAQGNTGNPGVTGATGPSGAQGNTGNPGITGATGPSGAQGNTGNPGVTGATGPSGAQGNTGNPGITGATGPSGAQGNTGNPGVTGATGPSGAQGIQGVQGASGEQGIQGVQGASGERGFSGASGERGFSGASGERGIQGISGPRGFTGFNGSNGTDGATGPRGFTGFNGSNGTDGATGPEGRSFVTLLGLNGAQILTPTSVRMTNLNHVVLSAEKFDRNQSAIYAQCTVPGNGTYNLQFGIRVDSDPNFTGYFFRITATQYRCLYGISADPDPSGSTPIKGSTNYSNDAIFSIIVDRTITRYLVNGVVVASTTNIPSDIAGYELYLSPVISDFIEVTNIRMYPTGLVGPSGPQGPQGPLAQVSNYVAQEIFHLACQETFSYESGNGTVVVPLGGRPSTLGRGDLVQIRTATNPAVQTRFLNPLSGNYWYVIGTIAGNGFGVTPTRYASTYTPTALEVGQNMLTTINTDYSRTKGVGTVPYVVLPGQTCLSVGLTNSANNGTDSTVFAGKPITFADANGGVSGSVVLTGTVYYLLQANYGGSVQRFTISRTRGGTVY